MKLFRRRLWDDEKRFGPLLIRGTEYSGARVHPGPEHVYWGLMPPTARSTEIKLALTLMGAVASGMDWPWP